MTIKSLKKLLRKCPICFNENGEVLHNQSFTIPENCALPETYDVICCAECGFVFADTSATQADYNLYYQHMSKYEDKNISSGNGETDWDRNRLEKTVDDIIKFLPDKNASILDIGCANGGLLKSFKSKGYNNLTGFDLPESCIKNTKELDIKAFKHSLFDIYKYKYEKFDCIVLSHVLEHIYDLHTAIDNVINLLKDDGILYIEVPDASRYTDYYVVPYYYFDCEHINHFDENSLGNLISQKKLKPLYFEKKEFFASSNEKYPAVYIVCQNSRNNNTNIMSNFNVKQSIISYVKKSNEADLFLELNKFVKTQEKIIVWGAGSYTLRLLKDSSLGLCNISAFIDNDSKKQGTKLMDIEIHPPLPVLKEHKGPIVICSALFSSDIGKQIKDLEVENKILVLK